MGGAGKTILLADDDPKVLDMLAGFLNRLRYNVIRATDGREALDLYEAHRGEINLLMLDVMMPKMKGTSVATAIREMDPDIPLLFVTGYGDEKTVKEMDKLKKYGLIRKPMQLSSLDEMIRCFLD